MTQKKLFLLDAMALIYRAYYAMVKSPRLTSNGLNTSAMLGFTNTLYEVIKNEKPTHIAVAFDTGAPTLRHADFDSYKANREATPDDIVTAIPYIKRIITAFGIPILSLDGYEADDIVGTVAKHAEIAGFEVYMMTSDKDYGQLVSEHIRMYKPGKFGNPAEIVGVEGICEKYGLQRPEQLIDILGLWGDSSDNIPGVPGIGEVKAKKLIAQFGSIENIYAHIDEVDNAKLRQTLVENEEQARMSKSLATIILDVPISYQWDDMKFGNIHTAELQQVFSELQFKALSTRIFNDPIFRTSATSAPDLFSAPTDFPMEENEIPQFEDFTKKEHHYIASHQLTDPLPDPLYFEWLLNNGKIAGFFWATEQDICYHLLENEHFYYQNLLKGIFENHRFIVTYNCKQTYKFLELLNIPIHAQLYDLQIAHYLIQPENAHALPGLAENYLSYKMIEEPKKNIPTVQELINRTGEQIEIYRRVYPIFSKELTDNGLTQLFTQIEMPLSAVLAKMENNGIYLDKGILAENSKQLNLEVTALEQQIYNLAGETFNLASPKQLGEILFEKLHVIDNAKLTKTKQYQTGEEILMKLANRHPIIPLILEWRSLSKLKSTYIDALPALVNPRTGRIHTTFNQTVTSTGRLSSTNPNLQNIPIRTQRGKDIRRAFTAVEPGSVIMSADYSQIELRIVAAVCGDKEMIDSFKNNEDIHTLTAARVYNVDVKEVTAEMRRTAKTVNFGILYGISAFGLAERLYISQKEARDLITGYYQHFPKIIQYLNDTVEFARANGYVETLLHRRRYIRDINSPNAILRKAAERNAINAPIQGTAADLIKIAMIRVDQAMTQRKLKSKMLLQIHDELVFEVPENEIQVMKELVTSTMNNAIQLEVPLTTEVNYGRSWFDAH
ncbi:MAG: DNA polymerase I [Bacteroidales bacterium]|nr:DNA polymerase I [Bacteroidales bacterium]